MKKRTIKGLSEDVSLLGFGCMRFPTLNNGEVDFDEAKRMLDYAVSKGVNYIDTAYPYHDGKSELIVKEIIKNYDRSKFFLADKLPLWDCKNNEDIDRIFHEQLDKCGVEYFDFYLIHAVNKERLVQVKELEVIKQLEGYKAEGKIRKIGFSFHDDLETFKLWADLYDWDFVQIQLNYMDIEHQQGIEGYHILTEKGIPVIVMEPVKGGSLAKFNPVVEKELLDKNPNASIASWAFRWVGSLPNVKVILSGMTTMEQVEDNINTFSNFVPLSDEEQELVSSVRIKLLELSKVDCTSCNYCMPCPHGVNIPGNFRIFNHHSMFKNDKHTKWAYGNLEKDAKSGDFCIECGECLPKCPQQIEIPTELANMQSYLKDNGIK
ncbi:MAG: aldo/keto reductase [Firmicutes bacterium]|nr:aldo/keto reductase [Bacillota bacterium]